MKGGTTDCQLVAYSERRGVARAVTDTADSTLVAAGEIPQTYIGAFETLLREGPGICW